MFTRSLPLTALFFALTACSGGDEGCVDEDTADTATPCSGENGPNNSENSGGTDGDEVVSLNDAPPQVLSFDVYENGGLLESVSFTDENALFTSTYSSGVLSISANYADGANRRLQLIVFGDVSVGDSIPIKPVAEGSLPDDATLTYYEDTIIGGAATGTLTITGWRATDSSTVFLLDGTFEAQGIAADGASWERDLQRGTLEAMRILSF